MHVFYGSKDYHYDRMQKTVYFIRTKACLAEQNVALDRYLVVTSFQKARGGTIGADLYGKMKWWDHASLPT
jgi:hypothetical protein